MPRNGSGTYSLPVGNPVVTGTTISSTWANNTLTDISNALTGSLSADGQTTASGNLNMGTNKIINLADPTNAQDAATKYYVDQLIAALGTMAYQDADAVDITGGDIASVSIDLHSMTNEVYLPVGPTYLRTASPINGLIRFNTDGGGFYEGYINGDWRKFTTVSEASYSMTYLIAAGGGGGVSNGGGGGGGGLLTATVSVVPETTYTITIGGGGAGGSGTNGSNSSITGLVTVVGGGAGGAAGGSGGGGAGGNESGSPAQPGGTGTTYQGYAGGSGGSHQAGYISQGGHGGGGGAGAVGGNGAASSGSTSGAGGNGGVGYASSITGISDYYAGGGGGGGIPSGGSGGSGGGGTGGTGSGNGTAGSTNTGGGGGGGSYGGTGANGGSGICILSVPTASYSGITTGSPIVTTSGSNTIMKFTISGSYTT